MNLDARTSSTLMPALRPLLRRLNAAVWLEHTLPALSVLAGLWATLMVLLKLLAPQWLTAGWASAAVTLCAPLYGYWQARRRGLFFAPRDGAELADHWFRNDGQVSAFFERPALYPGLDIAAFHTQLQQALKARSLRLRPTFYLRRLAPALLYVSAALLIPPRPPQEDPTAYQESTRALIEPIVQRLEEHKDLLPHKRLQEALADLHQLQESQDRLTREKWEALEQLEQHVQDVLDQSRQATTNVAEALRDLTSGPGFRENPLAAAQNPQFPAALQDLKELLNLSSADLPPGVREQLQSTLQQLDRMCQGESRLAGADRDVIMQQLEQLQEQLDSLLQNLEQGAGALRAGRGGRDRGRGDAAMAYGQPQPLANPQFAPDRLENRYLNPEDLVDLGITLLRPEPDPGQFSPGTLQSFDTQRGQAVSRTRISPSQREVVSKYFSERTEQGE